MTEHLTLRIRPGRSNAEELRHLLAAINDLDIAAGGDGFEFVIEEQSGSAKDDALFTTQELRELPQIVDLRRYDLLAVLAMTEEHLQCILGFVRPPDMREFIEREIRANTYCRLPRKEAIGAHAQDD